MNAFVLYLCILAFLGKVFQDGNVSANDGCKTMSFKIKLEGKALENHVFQTMTSSSERKCRVLCYMDDRCLSYNYGTSAKGDQEACELSESDHVLHDEDLVDRPDTVYLRGENNCNCPKDKTCRFNFIYNTHQCICRTGALCNSTSALTTQATTAQAPSSITEASPLSSSTGTSPSSSLTTGASPSSSSTTGASPVSSSTEASPASSSTEASPASSSTEASPASSSTEASSASSSTEASPASSSTEASPASSPTTATSSSSSTDCELHFITASTANMIKVHDRFTYQLEQFTVSFWLKAPSSQVTLYPFSYATTDQTSALSIAIKEDRIMEIGLNGGGKSIESYLKRDNTWQHFAVTWESSSGDVKLYYNGGQKASSETGLEQGKKVPKGGLFILGQKQGGYDEGFSTDNTMQGYLAGLNIWSSKYTSNDVSNLYAQQCDIPAGDVMSWATILAGELKGTLPKTCPATCHA